MGEEVSERYYASKQYPLPADSAETKRLNAQHRMIINAFEGRHSIAPMSLVTGDRILESAAGSGIWALEFFDKNQSKDIILDMQCIDISSTQFPSTHPPGMHFSVNSIVDLPNPEWSDTFSYAHQRLLVTAMNDSLWRSAVSELYRVLKPGGWVELLEAEAQELTTWSVGPNSAKVAVLVKALLGANGVIGNLPVYLPQLLKEAGFVDVSCEERRLSVGGEACPDAHKIAHVKGYDSEMWRNLWLGVKGPMGESGGFGVIKTAEEYEELLRAAEGEWRTSKEAYTIFYAILARKP
ncbi:hypothetical protein J3R30DRAFT_3405800 [Lentinula aciculospora]|uniref:S-adenosyl-L-methionine-dependent methyltransferase n=1 Tax=Lentinula aciculospora TaxID=153920 RepID=A0A9W9DL37_9AGAR|nr:hypothetical protein J3R30DRAFT_3405800 [Lentinula aciculospora]